jgi:hypothetical protein
MTKILHIKNNWSLKSIPSIGLEILAVLVFLSLECLLDNNMAVNEVDLLPLAKQYADPTWIPGDWYLNQPPGYRLLFQFLFGNLIVIWGFLATSVVGRLMCYGLVASGLVLISRKLELSVPLLLLAVSFFLHRDTFDKLSQKEFLIAGLDAGWIFILLAIGLLLISRKLPFGWQLPLLMLAFGLFLKGEHKPQSLVAGEWLVGGLEAKSVAYGLILLAIGLMLSGSYRWMALMLGLATSFHVLVGGYTFLAVLGWMLLRRKTRLPSIQQLGLMFLIYLVASSFAIQSVLEQLFSSTATGSLAPSYIYVFLRLPHHLNPLVWSSNWWVNLVLYLSILVLSVGVIRVNRSGEDASESYAARIGLFEFTVICLIPFILGLIVAPFDARGSFLQYYPFRLGDVMLPLNTCLLLACAFEQTFTSTRVKKGLLLVCILLLSGLCALKVVHFQKQVLALGEFPSKQQEVTPAWKNLCNWVRENTPNDALVVSPPAEFANFTWLADRPTVAKFKLLPQNKAGILAWYERLSDLNGNVFPLPTSFDRSFNAFKDIGWRLDDSYYHLTTARAKELMVKYQADYLMTRIEHQLDLPAAYRNQSYILYRRS